MNLETLVFVEKVKELYPNKFSGTSVLEIGSLDVNGSVRYRKGLFEGCDYLGIDLLEGKCVDLVVDYTKFQAPKKYDMILYLDAVEHDRFREKSFAKMWQDLKDDGIVIMAGSGPNCLPHFISYSCDNFYSNITVDWMRDVADRSALNVELIEENDRQDQIYAVFTKNINKEPTKRPLISLVSMVKNEEGVLQRMIDSVKDVVDEFIIVDTGSTDRTKEIIAKYGKVYEIPFENFVTTKNKSLDLATGEYILFMDADEVLYQGAQFIREWAVGGQVEGLQCKITEGPIDYNIISLQYDRLRLWRNDKRWKFAGPGVHECCVGPGPVVTDLRILVRHDHNDKAPESLSAEKYKFWKRILLEAIDHNQNDSRAWFYLGRTEVDLNNHLGAITAYRYYLGLQGNTFVDERWQAAFDMGKQYFVLGEFDKAIDAFDLAEKIDSRRREHLNAKAYIFFMKKEYDIAINIYELASTRPIPDNITLFLNPYEYTHLTDDQLILCYFFNKQYEKAELLAKKMTEGNYDQRLLNNLWWCRTKTNMKIFMALGETPEPIYGGMIECEGVGGVETTYIELSRTLSALGHDVFLFCNTRQYHVWDNVKYIPFQNYNAYRNLNPDVIVASRWLGSFDGMNCKKILWAQDANPVEGNVDFANVDKIIVSSEWHRNYMFQVAKQEIPKNKLMIIPLGLDKKLFKQERRSNNFNVVYSSNPNRGLDILADIWPEITRRIPNIHLTVLYGWQGLSTWSKEESWKKEVYEHEQFIKRKLEKYNTEFLGRVTKKQVADCLLSSQLLVYPCNFYETFCLTGLEAQAAGAVVVTSDMGALSTTVNRTGNVLLQGSPLSGIYQNEFISAVEMLMKNNEQFELRSVYNRNYVMNGKWDWSDIAKQWQELIWDIL